MYSHRIQAPNHSVVSRFYSIRLQQQNTNNERAHNCSLLHRWHKKPCCCCLIAKSSLTLWDPTDCSPPGSSVHGISKARTLEWVAISFSRFPDWRIEFASLALAGRFFTAEVPGKHNSWWELIFLLTLSFRKRLLCWHFVCLLNFFLKFLCRYMYYKNSGELLF